MCASLRLLAHFAAGPGSRPPEEYQLVHTRSLVLRPRTLVTPWKNADPTTPRARPAPTFTGRRRSAGGCGPGGGEPRSGGACQAPSTLVRAYDVVKTRFWCSPSPILVEALTVARRSRTAATGSLGATFS